MRISKVSLTVFFLLLFFAIFSAIVVLYNPQKPIKVRADVFNRTIDKNEVASLFTGSLAKGKNPNVLALHVPIEVASEGEVKKANFEFNAVGTSWLSELPEGTQIKVQLRFSDDGKSWSDWEEVEEDEDGPDKEKDKRNFGRIVFNEAKFFQEKLVFKTNDPKQIPSMENLRFTYVDSKEKNNLFENILKKIKLTVHDVFAAENLPKKPTEKPTVCSRACWGADESIYVPGEEYVPVRKIIIHHTVTTNNDPNPPATVRAIYYFHNIDRGWGDIGYNFLVDQNSGTIYEGRYGGEDVVGAHAKGYNYGSAGISVLGDFRYAIPNKKVQNSLHKLVFWKVFSRGLNPDEVSWFGNPGTKMPTVTYHGFVNLTSCAGTHLNNFVPTLISWTKFFPQQIILRNAQGGVTKIEGPNTKTVADLLNDYRFQGTVSPNYVRYLRVFPSDGTSPPNDDNFSDQWDLDKLNAASVWQKSTGGASSVKVAVLDTGVAFENYNPAGSEEYDKAPDFSSTNFVTGYDFVNNDNHPNDDNGHGTTVASVIAASTNNSEGSASLAYDVSIMPVKVCSNDGFCDDFAIAKGIDFARTNGVHVLNMSFGSGPYSQVLQNAIDTAWSAGVLLVAAAGNTSGSLDYPASGKQVLAVGSTTQADTRASYSAFGAGLDLVAPGGDGSGVDQDPIYQKLTCNAGLDCTNFDYDEVSGTSVSAALVSASAALLFSQGFQTGGNVESILETTATDIGTAGNDSNYGFGLVNPNAALSIQNSGGAILDRFGGIHNFGTMVRFSPTGYWPGWRIARSIAVFANGTGGYVLDGYGGLHAFGTATPIANNTHAYWPGWDIARDLVLLPSANSVSPKGYVLDGFGGIHPFGGANSVSQTGYWPGKDIANAIAVTSETGGYVLDGYGGINSFGTATPIANNTHAYWSGWDIARDFAVLPGTASGYLLDGFGGIHRFGGAPILATNAYWPGKDIARSIALTADGTKGYLLDGFGGIHPLGTAVALKKQNYSYWPGNDIAAFLVVR